MPFWDARRSPAVKHLVRSSILSVVSSQIPTLTPEAIKCRLMGPQKLWLAKISVEWEAGPRMRAEREGRQAEASPGPQFPRRSRKQVFTLQKLSSCRLGGSELRSPSSPAGGAVPTLRPLLWEECAHLQASHGRKNTLDSFV